MKIAEIDTDDLPIWMCAVVDTVSENCKKRLKTSPQYSRIVEESDKLLFQYPFILEVTKGSGASALQPRNMKLCSNI